MNLAFFAHCGQRQVMLWLVAGWRHLTSPAARWRWISTAIVVSPISFPASRRRDKLINGLIFLELELSESTPANGRDYDHREANDEHDEANGTENDNDPLLFLGVRVVCLPPAIVILFGISCWEIVWAEWLGCTIGVFLTEKSLKIWHFFNNLLLYLFTQ